MTTDCYAIRAVTVAFSQLSDYNVTML